MTKEKTSESFAKQFSELERIVEELEHQDDMDLDGSIKKFERGLELAHGLKLRLQEVDSKVKKIQQKFSSDAKA
jgi:exodeoxyribonuclease VII small subunit